jgi:hypothetical protein
MGVESREPTNYSGFSSLKTYINYRETRKTPYGEFLQGTILSKKSPSDHSEMDTKYAGAGWVQTIKSYLSQNRIENLVCIILGRFPIDKTQK